MKTAGDRRGAGRLGGGLTGCGGQRQRRRLRMPRLRRRASQDGFCEKFNGLYATLVKVDPKDTPPHQGPQGLGRRDEDYGTPSEMTGDVRDGYEIVIATFKDIDDDASAEDLQNVGSDVSAADNKKVQALQRMGEQELPDARPGRRILTPSPTGRPQTTRGGWPVSLTIGAAGRRPVEHAAVEVDDVVALLGQPRRRPGRSGRRPCRPRGSGRRRPRRAARAGRSSGCARRRRCGRAPTRRARARRAPTSSSGSGSGTPSMAAVGIWLIEH